jgi:hypothetical protein
MSDRPVPLLLGDVVRLRKRHPCGSDEWLVDRLGADIGLRCRGCDRHVMIERRALERRIVTFVSRGDPELTAAATPTRHGSSPDERAR